MPHYRRHLISRAGNFALEPLLITTKNHNLGSFSMEIILPHQNLMNDQKNIHLTWLYPQGVSDNSRCGENMQHNIATNLHPLTSSTDAFLSLFGNLFLQLVVPVQLHFSRCLWLLVLPLHKYRSTRILCRRSVPQSQLLQPGCGTMI